jgi:hypothetical protein
LRSPATILTQVFVVQFYRTNAGLFFLIMAFAGGFMRSQDHIALGEILVSTPLLSLLPLFLWSIYCLFVNNFNHETRHAVSNRFLAQLNLFDRAQRWMALGTVTIGELLPVLFYYGFLMALCLKHQLIASMMCLTFGILLLTASVAIALNRSIAKTAHETNENKLALYWRKIFRKPYTIVIMYGVLQSQALAILLYKVVSCLLLWTTIFLYTTDDYDLRLLSIGSTVCFGMSTPFIFEWHRFENTLYTIYRRAPVAMIQRLVYAILTLLLFYVPETLILFRNAPQTVVELMQILSYGVSSGLLIYSFLYAKDRKMEAVTSYGYIAGIALFVVILAGMPLIVLIMLNTVLAVLLYFYYYQRFEYTEKEIDQDEKGFNFP